MSITGTSFVTSNGFVGLSTEPSFAFDQRALLVRWRDSNLLWDCLTLLDDATVVEIERLGGLAGIAVSHPHHYGAMVEWAQRFDCPVFLHEADRAWVTREDPRLEFWSGDTLDLGEGLTLIRTGGHFAGSQVLHIAAESTVLAGDAVFLTMDPDWVSFNFASAQLPGGNWAQLLPLDEQATRRVANALEPFEFETIIGAWWDHVVPRSGDKMVQRSAERYIRALRGELAARTDPPNGGRAPAAAIAFSRSTPC